MIDKLTSKKNLPLIGVIIAGIILILTLFVFQIGVEDNGSLGARLEQMGLYDVTQTSGTGYYSQSFGVADKSISINPSYLIYTLCKQFFDVDTVMDSMFPAALYMIIYLLGIYLLLKALMTDIKWSNILLTVIFLLVLCDSAYTAYFNTPYGYAPMLAFIPLFASSVIMVAKSKNIYPIIIAGISGAFVFGSFAVSAVAGIVFGIYFLFFVFRKKEITAKIMCVICVCLIIISSAFQLGELSVQSKYDSVFYGALFDNANGAEEIGVSGYQNLAGVPSFDEKAQQTIVSGELDGKLSYGNIVSFYLKNPAQLYKNLKIAADNGTMIRTAYLGSYAPDSGKEASAVAEIFSVYSKLKAKFVPNNIAVLVLTLIIIAYFSIFYRNKYSKTFDSKVCAEISTILALAGIITIPVVVILFGVTQIVFNMFVFNLLFDFSVISAAAGGTKLLWIRRQALKEKYGVNQ